MLSGGVVNVNDNGTALLFKSGGTYTNNGVINVGADSNTYLYANDRFNSLWRYRKNCSWYELQVRTIVVIFTEPGATQF